MAKQNSTISRDIFLSNSRQERRAVEVEGITVYVKGLTGKGLLAYNEKIEELKTSNPELNASNSIEIVAYLIKSTLCDDEGTLLLTDEDMPRIMDKPFDTLQTLALVAMELSGLSSDTIGEAKKSLKNGQPNSSTSS